MNRGACLGFAALLAAGPATTAVAQTPVERGSYLVNTVMTCHNCHTPMGPNGPQFDKALSGGLRFNEPPFDVTGVQPHAGSGDRPRQMERRRHQEGPAGGRAADRPSPGRGHAHRLLQDSHARRSRRHRRLSALAEAGQQQGAGIPSTRWRSRTRCFPAPSNRCPRPISSDKVKRGFYLVTIAHCMECHTPFGPPGSGVDFQNSLGKGGREFPGPWGTSTSRNITLEQGQAASAIGATPTSSAPSRKACARTAAGSSRRWDIRYYAKMTDGDLDAMVAYLRTVPAKE